MTDKEHIVELQKALNTMLELYDKECKRHYETQMYVIRLQKKIMGIADDEK